MNRRGFLKLGAATAIAPAIASLEKWHGIFDDAYLAGVEPTVAVEMADLAIAPVSALTTFDSILKEYYLPVVREQLNGFQCSCGRDLKVHFLNRDGAVTRYSTSSDSAEATLAATCYECEAKSFYYLKYQFPLVSSQEVPGLMATVDDEVRLATRDFKHFLAGDRVAASVA